MDSVVLRKVSVIIPIFNLVDYVEQLIDNLKKQTYKNAEYLIIDDGSTDKSIDVLLTLTKNDTRFKIIQTRKTGVSDSRNLGLKIAAGEFVIFIDGDDFFEKDMVSQYVDAILSNDTDIEFFSFIRSKGSDLEKWKISGSKIGNASNDVNHILGQKDLLLEISKGVIGGYTFAYISKKSLWNGIGFPSNIDRLEDLYGLVQLLKRNPKITGHINNTSYYYYVTRESSLMNCMSWNDRLEILLTYQKIFALTAEFEEMIKAFYGLYFYSALQSLKVAVLSQDRYYFKRFRKIALNGYFKSKLDVRHRIYASVICAISLVLGMNGLGSFLKFREKTRIKED